MEYFSKGKRGKIYLIKNIAVKKSMDKYIKNEVKYLKLLNKHGIGPKLLNHGKNYFKYKFIRGIFILDYIRLNNKKNIKKILVDVLKQCRVLDMLKINKLEMHNPYKHIIIDKDPVMIDFERCYKTNKPKNVTQFCQFLISNNLKNLLNDKGFKIDREKLIDLAKMYKINHVERNFSNILKLIRNF